MKKLLIVLTAALSSGCQTTGGGSGCPPLVQYSAIQQQKVAAEMKALHKEAELRKFITDYGKLRDACRVE